ANRLRDDLVGAIASVHGNGIDLTIAARTACRRREVDVDLARAGAAQIVDDDVIAAAQRSEVDALDAVQIHRDVGNVAGETNAIAVGRDVDGLADVRAVELHRVRAGLTVDDIAAVTGIPDERIVAGAECCDIVAAPTDDHVVAGAAIQLVVAGPALQQ